MGQMLTNSRRLWWCALLVVVALGVAAPASAQTAGPSTYTGVTPPQLGAVQVSGAQAQRAVPTRVTSLAFTGADVIELVAVGIVLIGSGAVLRRLGRAGGRRRGDSGVPAGG